MPEPPAIQFSQLNCSTRQMCRVRASVRSCATTQALEMKKRRAVGFTRQELSGVSTRSPPQSAARIFDARKVPCVAA
jgi:hypothetical protein